MKPNGSLFPRCARTPAQICRIVLALALIGGLWMATPGQAARLQPKTASHPLTTTQAVTHLNPALSSPGDENWSSGFHLPGMNASVTALAVATNGDILAGGNFTTAGDVSASRIARWNGSSWSALGSGLNGSVNALAVDSSGNVYAGGSFTLAGGASANYVARWDGSTWSSLGSGLSHPVYALAVNSAGLLVAGGEFTTAGGVSASHVAQWNGSSWSSLGSGMDGSVNALAFAASDDLYAGGWFTNAGGACDNPVARWNGSAWSSLGAGMNSYVSSLAVDASDNLVAGGAFTTAGGVSASRVAQWNGSAWSSLGAGVNAAVTALVFDAGGNLVVGGGFTSAGGSSANYVAAWNGAAWSSLGSGMDSAVNALARNSNGLLVVGGEFTDAGGASANYIAAWDGAAWNALGSGLDSAVYALTLDDRGHLYAGGVFTASGGKPAYSIAHWTTAVSQIISGAGAYSFYVNNLPVTVAVTGAGDLARINIQRRNQDHAQATANLQTGYFWEIEGLNAGGAAASGFTVNLTLPTAFSAGSSDQLCRFTGSAWDCALDSFTANSVTRQGVTAFSDWAVEDNAPLAAGLADFAAQTHAQGILVTWETTSELDTVGFDLWRGTTPDTPGQRLNASLIPSQAPGSSQGFSYAWLDQDSLAIGATYFYWLDVVEISGASTRHGPVSAAWQAPTALTLDSFTANPQSALSRLWAWLRGIP